jgi:hypothetical protein
MRAAALQFTAQKLSAIFVSDLDNRLDAETSIARMRSSMRPYAASIFHWSDKEFRFREIPIPKENTPFYSRFRVRNFW